MSKRIHEGIRRGEFKFSELPQVVQEKDDAHCSAKATKETSAQAHVNKRKDIGNQTARTEATAIKDIDLGSVSLKDVKLVDANVIPTAASVPDTSGRGANGHA